MSPPAIRLLRRPSLIRSVGLQQYWSAVDLIAGTLGMRAAMQRRRGERARAEPQPTGITLWPVAAVTHQEVQGR